MRSAESKCRSAVDWCRPWEDRPGDFDQNHFTSAVVSSSNSYTVPHHCNYSIVLAKPECGLDMFSCRSCHRLRGICKPGNSLRDQGYSRQLQLVVVVVVVVVVVEVEVEVEVEAEAEAAAAAVVVVVVLFSTSAKEVAELGVGMMEGGVESAGGRRRQQQQQQLLTTTCTKRVVLQLLKLAAALEIVAVIAAVGRGGLLQPLLLSPEQIEHPSPIGTGEQQISLNHFRLEP